MLTLTEEQIKEIAEQLDCGFRCFWHKVIGEILFVPDFNNELYAHSGLLEDELQKLENNFDDYIEIEKPSSSDSFEIMTNFTAQLDENDKLKNRLIKALNNRKPFREFKLIIDNSGAYRQQWFDFKNGQLKQLVRERFKQSTDDRKSDST